MVAAAHVTPAGSPRAFSFDGFLSDVAHRLPPRSILITVGIGWIFSVLSYLGFLADPLRDHSLHFYLVGHVPLNVGAGICLLLAFVFGDSLVAFGARPLPAYLLTLATAVVVFGFLQFEVRHWFGLETSVDRAGFPVVVRRTQILYMIIGVGQTAGTIAFVYINRQRAIFSLRQLQAARLERAEVERAIVGSRLQAMQARIEPQLLSDALECVKRLYETDIDRADTLLDDLIQYLRAALPQLRSTTSTIGREMRLSQAYVNILTAMRGGAQSCEVEVPSEREGDELPPMLLLPLVAQALRLGADLPFSAGLARNIRLRTKMVNGRLSLLIEFPVPMQTDEPTLRPPAEVTERLHALFDNGATLRTERMSSERVRYRLDLPSSRLLDAPSIGSTVAA